MYRYQILLCFNRRRYLLSIHYTFGTKHRSDQLEICSNFNMASTSVVLADKNKRPPILPFLAAAAAEMAEYEI